MGVCVDARAPTTHERVGSVNTTVRLAVLTSVGADMVPMCNAFVRYYVFKQHIHHRDIYVMDFSSTYVVNATSPFSRCLTGLNVFRTVHPAICKDGRCWNQHREDGRLELFRDWERRLLTTLNYTHVLTVDIDEIVAPHPRHSNLHTYLSRNAHRKAIVPSSVEVQPPREGSPSIATNSRG